MLHNFIMREKPITSRLIQTFQPIADFVFPPSKDALVVRGASADTFYALMHHSVHADPQVLLPYHERVIRACVHEAKFHHNTKAFELLGSVLAKHVKTLPEQTYTLFPVPLSRARFRERGYNQVTEVAKGALKKLPHIALREDILVRTRHTKKQTDLQKEEREKNVTNAFACPVAESRGVRNQQTADSLADTHIILLDDVLTTGATMKEARKALKKFRPASITCIALAG